MKTAHAIIVGLIIGFLGGIGVQQMTMGNDVREHTTRIIRVEKDVSDERTRNEKQYAEILKLVAEVIASNREQMQVMKTQNELLRQMSGGSR